MIQGGLHTVNNYAVMILLVMHEFYDMAIVIRYIV